MEEKTFLEKVNLLMKMYKDGSLDGEVMPEDIVQNVVAQKESKFAPINLHTPLWLWSRAGFPALE